jgi:demethylmenaquinone methyltransferase/2-methoxy-6-polyprenyl-1,4-benzoquinol methylase
VFPADVDLYDPAFVRRLFDEMSTTYGTVNVFSSFGFCIRWRRQCVNAIHLPTAAAVVDLMSGMGELHDPLRRQGKAGTVIAVDVSAAMCRQAERLDRRRLPMAVVQADALRLPLADQSADAVICSFGLKTFSPTQIEQLAQQVHRILRPGGAFSFLEISVPPNRLLRWPYLFYLNRVIPRIGRLFMGNPDNYRLLGVYTTRFGGCRQARDAFASAGLEARLASYFFGCATGVIGCRPP